MRPRRRQVGAVHEHTIRDPPPDLGEVLVDLRSRQWRQPCAPAVAKNDVRPTVSSMLISSWRAPPLTSSISAPKASVLRPANQPSARVERAGDSHAAVRKTFERRRVGARQVSAQPPWPCRAASPAADCSTLPAAMSASRASRPAVPRAGRTSSGASASCCAARKASACEIDSPLPLPFALPFALPLPRPGPYYHFASPRLSFSLL